MQSNVDDDTVDKTVIARRDDGYVIDVDPRRLDEAAVQEWISNDSYWASGRTPEVMSRAMAGSACFGVYAPDGRQVAFARVVTDHATFAWLCDVYVARDARGRGLGTWLARSIVEHVLGWGIARIVLATRDAHAVYAKAGFAPFGAPERWMEIDLRPALPTGDVQHT
jgi:GNAT superfamily N-acetyltransferase